MRRSLRSPLWRVPLAREVDEELDLHLELLTRDLVARGMDPAAARQAARRRMGDLARVRRTCMDLGRRREREMRLTRWLDELRYDLRFALRQLRRAPVFTLVAAATLALGIGANGAIFALVDATLLRPLPFPEPHRLVAVWESTEIDPREGASPLNVADWNERSRTFERLAGYIPNVGGMVLAGADGSAETVPRQWVSAGVFAVLGVRPVAGRTFLPEDDRRRANVVVLNERFWRARFGGDPAVVGSDLRLDGEPYTVVGVVPPEAEVIGRTEMWALRSYEPDPGLRGAHFLAVVGRMKPGVGLDAAAADLAAVAGALAHEYPETNAGRGVTLAPFRDAVIGSDLRLTSLLFVGVVGVVLLICCANVANLLMARATVRTRELAVRSALGAGRPRVVRQLLTESLVLAALGGALGVGVGAAILRVAPSVIPAGLLPAAVTLSFDLRVVGFCTAAALLVGVLFGLAPAWRARELTSAQAIATESRTASVRAGRLREVLVVAEVATAVVLVFGAGLLLRTLLAVDNVDRGYRAESVLTMLVDPLGARYPTPEALLGFYDEIEREVRAVPGVGGVAWATTLPMGDSILGELSVEVVGDPPPDEARRPTADLQVVSPTYFETLGLPVIAGRGFDRHDTRDGPAVCIVNEEFARRHLQGRPPIGRKIALRPADQPQAPATEAELVGVARQVKGRPDEREAFLQVYAPLARLPIDDIYLLVRPASGHRAEALMQAVRGAIGRVDEEQLVSVRDIATLDDVARGATGRHRLRAVMVGTFAGLALLLAMVGVFGILTYSVQQRIGDFAMRRALGASGGDVTRLVAAGAARVIVTGAVIGLALSALAGRLIASMLFGVEPLDPTTFLFVLLLLAATGALSVAGPAWRAARIDPAAALRDG